VLEEHLLNLDAARGWLGYDLDLDTLTVTSIVPGGPAATAGMQTGDRIASIDGRPTEDAAGYRLARIAVWPGRTAELVVRRGADSRALQVEPWNQGNGILFDRLGLTVEALVIDRMRRRVVRVASLRPDGPAAQVGQLTGDIIDAVQPEDRRTQIVGSPEEFALVVQRFQAGTRLMVDIWRDENQNNRLERTDTYSELFNGYLTLQ
jgi:C-terminal processing protease CtpA/Prc